MAEFQIKFYRENEYFRFVNEKQLYRLFKRTKRKDKDISSYVRFFTNGESTKDDVPSFESSFNGSYEKLILRKLENVNIAKRRGIK